MEMEKGRGQSRLLDVDSSAREYFAGVFEASWSELVESARRSSAPSGGKIPQKETEKGSQQDEQDTAMDMSVDAQEQQQHDGDGQKNNGGDGDYAAGMGSKSSGSSGGGCGGDDARRSSSPDRPSKKPKVD